VPSKTPEVVSTLTLPGYLTGTGRIKVSRTSHLLRTSTVLIGWLKILVQIITHTPSGTISSPPKRKLYLSLDSSSTSNSNALQVGKISRLARPRIPWPSTSTVNPPPHQPSSSLLNVNVKLKEQKQWPLLNQT
jgi:hypothetical protein